MPSVLTSTIDCSPKRLPDRPLRLEQSARSGDKDALLQLKGELELARSRESDARSAVREARDRIYEYTHVLNWYGMGWFKPEVGMWNIEGVTGTIGRFGEVAHHQHDESSRSCPFTKAGITPEDPDIKKIESISETIHNLCYSRSGDSREYRRLVAFEEQLERQKIPINGKHFNESVWKWFAEARSQKEAMEERIEKSSAEILRACKDVERPFLRVAKRLIKATGEKKKRMWAGKVAPPHTIQFMQRSGEIDYTCNDINREMLERLRIDLILTSRFMTPERAKAHMKKVSLRKYLMKETEACDRTRALEMMLRDMESPPAIRRNTIVAQL
jgi:hypothetical protein